MKRFTLPAVLIGLWLLAWADGTGVLVWSERELIYNSPNRLCYYLIGVSILRVVRMRPDDVRRCPLLAQV